MVFRVQSTDGIVSGIVADVVLVNTLNFDPVHVVEERL